MTEGQQPQDDARGASPPRVKALVAWDAEGQPPFDMRALDAAGGSALEITHTTDLATASLAARQDRFDLVLIDLALLRDAGAASAPDFLNERRARPLVVIADMAELRRLLRSVASRRGLPLPAEAQGDGAQVLMETGRLARAVGTWARTVRPALRRQEWYAERLHSFEEHFRDMVEKSLDAVVIVDSAGVARYVNPAAAGLFDRPRESLVGQLFGYPAVAGRTTELEIVRPSGDTRVAEMVVADIEWEREPAVLASLRDITEHKRNEAALRALTRRVVETQEEERQALARELHDQVGSSLTGLRFSLDLAARLPRANAEAKLREALALTDSLVERVRSMSVDLRPAMLDDLGLLPALLWHFDRFTAQTGVQVHFRHNGPWKTLGQELRLAVYRIIQEALTNVARHSGAGEAFVELRQTSRTVYVEVRDEGRGFDPAEVARRPSAGLTGMRERVMVLGGRLQIASAPGGGTCVSAALPLRGARKRGEGQK